MSATDPAFEGQAQAVLSQRLRLVYPFRIPRESLSEARATLEGSGIWHPIPLSEEFRKEMLEAASQFVFGALRDQPAPNYFRHQTSFAFGPQSDRDRRGIGPKFAAFLNGTHGLQWLVNPVNQRHNPQVERRDRPVLSEFLIDADLGAEMFLNPFGSGIVCLTLLREFQSCPQWCDLLDFVYHLSHIKYRPPLIWRVDADRPLSQLDQLPEGVSAKSVIEDTRIAACRTPPSAMDAAATRNAPFTALEIFTDLLQPLESAAIPIEGEQGQLMGYSVVEFDDTVGFANAAPYLAQLCAMAQLEEAAHPPTVATQGIVETLALTDKHLAAATSMGVVHFVARQFPADRALPYDDGRAARLLVKYFASTLAAYFQFIGVNGYMRQAVLVLDRASKEARETPGDWDAAAPADPVVEFSDEVTRFTASANLALINRRESHNRYYQCLRRAFHVEQAMRTLQYTLRDMSLSREARGQVRALGMMHQHQVLLGKTQEELHQNETRLGNLELFVVLVYVVEMARIFGELTGAKAAYTLWTAVTGLFGTLAVVMPMVKRWPHWLYNLMPGGSDVDEQKRHASLHGSWAIAAGVALVIYLLALLVPYSVPALREVPPAETHRQEIRAGTDHERQSGSPAPVPEFKPLPLPSASTRPSSGQSAPATKAKQ